MCLCVCVCVCVCVWLHDSIKRFQEMLFMWYLYGKFQDRHGIEKET